MKRRFEVHKKICHVLVSTDEQKPCRETLAFKGVSNLGVFHGV